MIRNLKTRLSIDTSIGLIVKITEKALERALDSELKDRCGLVGSQWKVITVLAITEGPSQKELAELVFVESPTLVPILDKMEKLGLISRKADPIDRRTKRIYLTNKSKKMVDSIVECIVDFRSSVTKDITKKDLDITATILKKIAYNADKIIEEKGISVPKNILEK